jgi:hypothetical protein
MTATSIAHLCRRLAHRLRLGESGIFINLVIAEPVKIRELTAYLRRDG